MNKRETIVPHGEYDFEQGLRELVNRAVTLCQRKRPVIIDIGTTDSDAGMTELTGRFANKVGETIGLVQNFEKEEWQEAIGYNYVIVELVNLSFLGFSRMRPNGPKPDIKVTIYNPQLGQKPLPGADITIVNQDSIRKHKL